MKVYEVRVTGHFNSTRIAPNGSNADGWITSSNVWADRNDALEFARQWQESSGWSTSVFELELDPTELTDARNGDILYRTRSRSRVADYKTPPRGVRDLSRKKGSKKDLIWDLVHEASYYMDNRGDGYNIYGRPAAPHITYGEAVAIYGEDVVGTAMKRQLVYHQGERDKPLPSELLQATPRVP